MMFVIASLVHKALRVHTTGALLFLKLMLPPMEFTDLLCSLITASQLTLHANIAKLHPPMTWPILQCIFLSTFNFDSSVGVYIYRLQYASIKAHIVITLTCET